MRKTETGLLPTAVTQREADSHTPEPVKGPKRKGSLLLLFAAVLSLPAFILAILLTGRLFWHSDYARIMLGDDIGYLTNEEGLTLFPEKVEPFGVFSARFRAVRVSAVKDGQNVDLLTLNSLTVSPSFSLIPFRYIVRFEGDLKEGGAFAGIYSLVIFSFDVFKDRPNEAPHPGEWTIKLSKIPLQVALGFFSHAVVREWAERSSGTINTSLKIRKLAPGLWAPHKGELRIGIQNLNLKLAQDLSPLLKTSIAFQDIELNLTIADNVLELPPSTIDSPLGSVTAQGRFFFSDIEGLQTILFLEGNSLLFSLIRETFHCRSSENKVRLEGMGDFRCF